MPLPSILSIPLSSMVFLPVSLFLRLNRAAAWLITAVMIGGSNQSQLLFAICINKCRSNHKSKSSIATFAPQGALPPHQPARHPVAQPTGGGAEAAVFYDRMELGALAQCQGAGHQGHVRHQR